MANRRHIGHNRSFSGNSMSVNPWQGGVPPTVSGISQLTDTQAQLALALTNLLRPPVLQQSQPLPSLLNLPQINPTSSYGDYHRQNYDDYDRDRYMSRSSNIRRGRYSDKIQNRPSRDRRRNDHHRKSDGRSNNDNSKNNKERSLSKTKETESKPDSESKTDNQSEESEDKKRDWKEEKNNGNNQDNEHNDETKNTETDLDNENEHDKDKIDESIDKSTDDNKSKDTKTEKTRNKDGRYAGIPVEFLKCLVCEKSMWDGESFEKHLRGRAHQQMLDSLRDTYDVQADMMRQAIRLAEERKAIELNRKKRHGKRVEFRKVSHCNMCAFDFYGREAEHRRSPGHQKLKRFLHPRCKRCHVEFPIKIEWEEHRLTPEHIRKLMETKEDADAASVDLDSSDDIFDINLNDGDFEEEDNDPDNVILDFDDNTDLLTNFDNRIPVYKKSRNVGHSTITEITGHFCKLCNQFFRNEIKAQSHGKSKSHYDNFIKYLKNKNSEKIKQNEKEEQAKKRDLEKEGKVEDEDGNWKRRKVSAENQPEGSDEKQEKELKKDDLYDPMEAEDEDDDEEDDVKIIDNDKPVEQTSEIVEIKSETSDTNKSKLNETVEEETESEENKKNEIVTPTKNEETTEENTPGQRVTRNTRTSARRPGPLSKTRGAKK